MFIYNSATGRFCHDDAFWAKGYSGHEKGKNNPSEEAITAEGPIPRGMWHIGKMEEDHPKLGPHVFALTPVGHDAHGRSAFFIHGDSIREPGFASHGCIILDRETRLKIEASGDFELHVV